jgi:hypothetical protein
MLINQRLLLKILRSVLRNQAVLLKSEGDADKLAFIAENSTFIAEKSGGIAEIEG